jgi:hypothetical protein
MIEMADLGLNILKKPAKNALIMANTEALKSRFSIYIKECLVPLLSKAK